MEDSIVQLKDDSAKKSDYSIAEDSTRDLTIVPSTPGSYTYSNKLNANINLPNYKVNLPLSLTTTQIIDLFVNEAKKRGYILLERSANGV